jgi:hypothetical protein
MMEKSDDVAYLKSLEVQSSLYIKNFRINPLIDYYPTPNKNILDT